MTLYLFARFDDPEQLVDAARSLRGRTDLHLDAYTPYPVDELADALGDKPSRLPVFSFYAGVLGTAVTYAIQWFLNAYLYPINVGDRPAHFPLSYVPICFEVGILFASVTAFIYVFKAGRLGRLWDPVLELDALRDSTRDAHWLSAALGPHSSSEELEELLRTLGANKLLRQELPPCG